MRRTPALILGGGPAGAATAIVLARAGAKHLLIERQRETGDAICGGFLSWRTLETLAALGIDAGELNPESLTELRLFSGKRQSQSRLPHPAKAVSRHRLDTLLLDKAIEQGAAIERGVMVQALEDGITRTHDGESFVTDALFLANGKHELRGAVRPAKERVEDPSIGLRVRLGPAPKMQTMLAGAIELHLFDRGYAGLNLQEDGTANLCLAVRLSLLTEAGSPDALLKSLGHDQPHLGDRLEWRDQKSAIDAIANVPYGWRVRSGVAGQFRLGDQAGVIPSLAGEGMGIAVASGMRAAQAYIRDGANGAIDFQNQLSADLARPIGIASAIRAMGESQMRKIMPAATYVPGLANVLARLTRIEHTCG